MRAKSEKRKQERFHPRDTKPKRTARLVFLCLSGELCLAGFQFQQGLLAFDSPAVTPHFSVRADNAMAWNGYCNWVGGASSGYGAHGRGPANGFSDLRVGTGL